MGGEFENREIFEVMKWLIRRGEKMYIAYVEFKILTDVLFIVLKCKYITQQD